MRYVVAPQLRSIPLDTYEVDELEDEVDRLAELLDGYQSTVLLVGGLGLAVAHGRYYRNHRDVDIAIYLDDVERFIQHLDRVGYDFKARRRSFRLYPKKRVYILEPFDRARIREVIDTNKRFRAVRRTRSRVLFQRRRTDYFDVLFYERVPGGVRMTDRGVIVPIEEFEPVRPVRVDSPLAVCNPGYRTHIRPNGQKQIDDYVEYGVVPPELPGPMPLPPRRGDIPIASGRASLMQRMQTVGRSYEPRSAREEADQLWLLLAYVSVVEDWQHNDDPDKRGHNIGSLLVDRDGRLVGRAMNSIGEAEDGSRHGEVVLMEERIRSVDGRYLEGHTLYTTLEPCAMCAGMATMLRIGRVVYGQPDPDFGGTLTRLRRWGSAGRPYPIRVRATAGRDPVSRSLDVGYRAGSQQIITYLYSREAQLTMGSAHRLLRNHTLRFEANRGTLRDVLGHLDHISNAARSGTAGERR